MKTPDKQIVELERSCYEDNSSNYRGDAVKLVHQQREHASDPLNEVHLIQIPAEHTEAEGNHPSEISDEVEESNDNSSCGICTRIGNLYEYEQVI